MRNDFFISDTGGLEEKIRVEPVTSPNVSGLVIGYTPVVRTRILFWAICVIIKNSFSQINYPAPKVKIPVRSDLIQSNLIRSDPEFDPIHSQAIHSQAIQSGFCWRPF